MAAAISLLVLGMLTASWVLVLVSEFRLSRLERRIDRFIADVEEHCRRAAALDQWLRDDRE